MNSELMKIVGEMRGSVIPHDVVDDWADRLDAIAKAQPVAWRYTDAYGNHFSEEKGEWFAAIGIEVPLYTAPPAPPSPPSVEGLVKDAARYRWLRNEDNWGCDNNDATDSRWGDLGELHGEAFDTFVDNAMALAAYNKERGL